MTPALNPALHVFTALLIVAASLFAAPLAGAEGKKDDGRGVGGNVVINGGTVTNETTIDISADGGTAIADASGGDDNVATVFDGDDDDDDGVDIASAGNGGTATASANGGAVSIGNVNSGGNTGNVITVGDTGGQAAAPAPPKAAPPAKPVAAPKKAAVKAPAARPGKAPAARPARVRARGGDRVRRLPSAGVGVVQGQTGGEVLFLLAGSMLAAGAASVALRKRSLAKQTA